MEITNNQIAKAAIAQQDVVSKASPAVDSNTARVNSPEPVVAPQQAEQEPAQNLQGAVSQINDYVQNLQRSLLFTVDEASGKDVVTVLDSETEEVIRQYPSEEVLDIARRLAEQKEEQLNLFSSRI